jgi:hypothetical protein
MVLAVLVVFRFFALRAKNEKLYWIDGAQFQPAQAGFVVQAEGFSPAGNVQHLIDQYRKNEK